MHKYSINNLQFFILPNKAGSPLRCGRNVLLVGFSDHFARSNPKSQFLPGAASNSALV